MTQRNTNAIAINQGAVNPSAIALAIADACREMRADPDHTGTAQLTSDPAIRLMVYQLAYICGVTELAPADYSKIYDACNAAAAVELRGGK